MPDLAWAMKYNPNLKVQLNAGYFDLSTPFYESIYEMRQLPMPTKLQANIECKFYQSGHMVYAHEAALKELHDNVVAFIRSTDHVPANKILNGADVARSRRLVAARRRPWRASRMTEAGHSYSLAHL